MALRGLSGGFVSLHHRLISLKPPAWDAPEPEARKTLGFRGFTKHDEVRYNSLSGHVLSHVCHCMIHCPLTALSFAVATENGLAVLDLIRAPT
jgi:hypothetical protein